MAAMVALALALTAGTAWAAPSASISVSPSTVAPGGTVHISGSVSPADCPVDDAAIPVSNASLFPPDGFGPSTDRDSSGAFELDYTVPATTPSGTYEIGLRCGGGNVGVTARLQVAGTPVGGISTGAGGTAGGGSQPWVLIALTSLSLAGLMLTLRRRLSGRVA